MSYNPLNMSLSRRGLLAGAGAMGTLAFLAACSTPNGGGSGDAALQFLWRNFPTEEDAFREMIAKFTKENPGITVEETYVPIEGYDQRFDLMLSGGTPPAVWSSVANRGTRYYASRDQLIPLDDFIAGSSIDLSNYSEQSLTLGQWGGKQVALPNEALTLAIVYNKTMFEAEGIPLPPKDWNDPDWNWDTFLEYAKALTKGTDQYGFQGFQDLRYDLADFGVSYWEDDGNETGYPQKLNTSDEFVDALSFIGDLINVHKVQPDAAMSESLNGLGLPDLFVSGKFGMKVTFMGSISTYATIEDFEYGYAAMPMPVDLPRLGFYYPGAIGVPVGTGNEEASFKLLEFFAQPEQQEIFPIAAQNWMSSLTSLGPSWTSTVSGVTGVPEDEIVVFQDSLVNSAPAFGAYAVEWQQFWDTAFNPNIQALTLGQLTGPEAAAAMQEPFDRVVESTTP